jgi:hypothetical protein
MFHKSWKELAFSGQIHALQYDIVIKSYNCFRNFLMLWIFTEVQILKKIWYGGICNDRNCMEKEIKKKIGGGGEEGK